MLRFTRVLTLSGLLLTVAVVYVGAQAITTYLPPRTAVVDISEVFDSYKKSKDRQASLQSEIDRVRSSAEALVQELQVLEAELKSTSRDSPSFQELVTRKLKLQFDLDKLQKQKGQELEGQLTQFLQEIKTEITREIAAFAEAEDLDLVLEQKFRAEGAPGRGFTWPIVHYHKPEYDITKEVSRRLNERYSRAN